MDQTVERLLDRRFPRLWRQLREPPLNDPVACVLCVRILAQVFLNRPHSLSYARFVHHTSSAHCVRSEQELIHVNSFDFLLKRKRRWVRFIRASREKAQTAENMLLKLL